MHVLFVSLELAPFSKVGGLGDVAQALPAALQRLGLDVTVLTPWYRTLPEKDARLARLKTVRESTLVLGDVPVACAFREPDPPLDGPRVVFVDEPHFLSRDWPYAFATDATRAIQEPEGLILFAKAVVDWTLEAAGPETIVHLNDHHPGLAAPLLKRFSNPPPVVITVHNFAHHGVYDWHASALLGLGPDELAPGGPVEFYGRINLLKAGLWSSDAIVTVSPTYRDEALAYYQTALGLEGVLRDRAHRFSGIINGVDTDVWNPRTSPHIDPHYDADSLGGKAKVKARLREEMGLGKGPARPLVGIVSRLVEQKGVELVLGVAERLLERADLVVLGAGLDDYERRLAALAERFPDRCRAVLRFDEGLAHRITAGADLFLMPSLFEPCGLNQMYALAFGTVPVVRRTGGLADTVRDVRTDPGAGTGFLFADPTPAALWETLSAALDLVPNRRRWQALMRRGMAEDHGWGPSAERYAALYRALLPPAAPVAG